MANYPDLTKFLAAASGGPGVFDDKVIPYLIKVWLDDYGRVGTAFDVVETEVDGFNYLFDIAAERLLAAFGVSRGRHGEPRDRSRMAGHPLSAGPLYHRGHAIPHTLGGPTDINLVPQLGAINVGPFRELEKRAVATPGSLYFTYWIYRSSRDQKPIAVDQGLLILGRPPEIHHYRN